MSKTPVVSADRFSPVPAYGEGELFCPGIGRRILEEWHQARALQVLRGLQAAQFGKGWVEVKKFGNMLGRLAMRLLALIAFALCVSVAAVYVLVCSSLLSVSRLSPVG